MTGLKTPSAWLATLNKEKTLEKLPNTNPNSDLFFFFFRLVSFPALRLVCLRIFLST